MSFIRLFPVEDLWDGEKRGVRIEEHKILVLRWGDKIFAYEDRCAHLGVALSDGCLENAILTCKAHAWQYDAQTGCGINPTSARLKPYPVRVQDGDVWVDPEGG